MSDAVRTMLTHPELPAVYEELCRGRLRWDLVDPFPRPEPGSPGRIRADDAVAELDRVLDEHLDPEAMEASRRMPGPLLDALRSRRLLDPRTAPDLGGLGLGHFDTFRLVTAAASRSVPVALVTAVQTAIGLNAYLAALPRGPLRDLVRERMSRGAFAGTADTEPAGAANTRRFTTATPVDGGEAYLLRGRKVFIGNAPIADLLAVTATVPARGDEDAVTRLFFVDADSPGLEVGAYHEYMGIKGFSNGPVTLRDVRVPAARMLVEDREERLTPSLNQALVRGRLYLIAAPSLAIARRCLEWSRSFVNRRSVNGRGLGEYAEIQRIVAASLADTFALESVVEWCLLAEDAGRPVNLLFEQVAAKNITSTLCWRVVERTMSLLAAEGYETAASKAARGADPIPLERAYRDARGLRISGGVDFQLDNWAGRLLVFPPHDGSAEAPAEREPELPEAAGLCPRNREHLMEAGRQARGFALDCAELTRRHPDRAALHEREGLMITASRIVNELLTVTLVLARAARRADRRDGNPADAGRPNRQAADLHCTRALHRVAELRRSWIDPDGPAAAAEPLCAELSAAWLESAAPDPLPTLAKSEGSTR